MKKIGLLERFNVVVVILCIIGAVSTFIGVLACSEHLENLLICFIFCLPVVALGTVEWILTGKFFPLK
jgi:hypothetical protein